MSMNIFMSEPTIEQSVAALDDSGLNKQILECRQIINANDRVLAGEEKVGYANHPVVVFYRDKRDFLLEYGYHACTEYYWRFGKKHSYDKYFEDAFILRGSPLLSYPVCYIDKRPGYNLFLISASLPIEYDSVSAAKVLVNEFRKKLVNKWDNDKRKPKWTRRGCPSWYENKE